MTSSNSQLRKTIVLLERAGKQKKAPIWTAASRILGSPSSLDVEVNIGRLSRLVEEGQVVFVPGKVLGTGVIDKKVTVGAYSFSNSAITKIVASGGKVISVEDMVKEFPDGRGVKLVE
jgi:large subunit ribosomal protein L18e